MSSIVVHPKLQTSEVAVAPFNSITSGATETKENKNKINEKRLNPMVLSLLQ